MHLYFFEGELFGEIEVEGGRNDLEVHFPEPLVESFRLCAELELLLLEVVLQDGASVPRLQVFYRLVAIVIFLRVFVVAGVRDVGSAFILVIFLLLRNGFIGVFFLLLVSPKNKSACRYLRDDIRLLLLYRFGCP